MFWTSEILALAILAVSRFLLQIKTRTLQIRALLFTRNFDLSSCADIGYLPSTAMNADVKSHRAAAAVCIHSKEKSIRFWPFQSLMSIKCQLTKMHGHSFEFRNFESKNSDHHHSLELLWIWQWAILKGLKTLLTQKHSSKWLFESSALLRKIRETWCKIQKFKRQKAL